MNWLNLDLGALRFNLNSQKSIPLLPVNFQVLDDAFRFVKKDEKPGNLIYVPGKFEVILSAFTPSFCVNKDLGNRTHALTLSSVLCNFLNETYWYILMIVLTNI